MSFLPELVIVQAMMVQDRFEEVRENLERVKPFVDRAVVVDNGSTDGLREWLLQQDWINVVLRRWDDSFVAGRNAYLRAIDDLAKDTTDPLWVAVADSDEFYSEGLLRDLRALCESAWEEDLNLLRVRSKSVETDWMGDVHWSQLDQWHKPLLILHEPNIKYRGIGNSEVHEDLIVPSGRREALVPDLDGTRYYEHRKKHGAIWLRGIRNFFAGGGGPNLGEANPLWRPFRELVKAVSGVTTAAEFVKYLEAGQVDSQVLAWFQNYRLLGTKFDDTPPLWDSKIFPDGTSEVREGWLAYFIYLHPEQLPTEFIEKDKDYIDYRSECRTIWGPQSPAWAEWK